MVDSNKFVSQARKRPRTHPSSHTPKRLSSSRPPTAPASASRGPALELVSEQPTSNMRSFSDLLGNAPSRAEQLLGEHAPEDAWASIANTLDNMPSASLLPVVAEEGSKAVANNRNDQPVADRMNMSTEVVLDLSLKKKIRVISAIDLKWATGRDMHTELTAFGLVLGNKRENTQEIDCGRDVENTKRLFSEALLNFRYPSEGLPMSVAENWQFSIANYGKKSWQIRPAGDMVSFAVQRLLRWQGAFQGLYFAYRRMELDSFYVLLPTTTVLFNLGRPLTEVEGKAKRRRPDIGDMEVRASVARASTGFRALMTDYQVNFTVIGGTSGLDEPCVVVEGVAAVHALYNFLLARGPQISNATDVPMLLADAPFRGCAMVSAEVSKARRARGALGEGRGEEDRYSLDIAGLLTPRQVKGICEALAVTQDGDFTAHFETDITGGMLNFCGHGKREGEVGEEQGQRLGGFQVLSRIRASPGVEGFAYATRHAS